mmetsp:Transcript_6032/g.14726  ORF Transcript_6032/g.14726 Transcript_6032/m.14726 type:complete len:262 (-) Transcript_6032:661-1446(-)
MRRPSWRSSKPRRLCGTSCDRMQRERELFPRKRRVTSGPNRMQFCPRCAALATPWKSQGSDHMQSNSSESSIVSVEVGHWRRRLRVRRCWTSTESRRNSPPCTTNTFFCTTVAIGSTSKSWENIIKTFASYFDFTSSKKPPPWSAPRRFISMFSWLPRLMDTFAGYSCLYISVITRISTAFSPRSAMSPLRRYPFSGDGSPFCFSTQRKSASCPCVSPQITSFPSGVSGTAMSYTEFLRSLLKRSTDRPTSWHTYFLWMSS